MGKRIRRGGGNARKINRDLKKCAAYRANKTREKNKIKKLNKHLKSNPRDKTAWDALKRYERFVLGS